MMRSCAPIVAVVLVGCGPETADESADGSTTTGSTTSDVEPTTSGASTGEQVDPCTCDEPVVHDGDLLAEDLAKYQGKCLVEVTGLIDIDELADPSLLTSLAHLQRARFLRISDSPGVVDLEPLSCLRETIWLHLGDNPELVDVGGLAGVEVAEQISFSGLPIEELPSFAASYQGVRSLHLHDLPALRDVDAVAGWPGLHDGDGEFQVTITSLPKLESVAGLAGPIGSASAKTTPEPLDGWPSIELGELPALATIDGLEALTRGHVTLRRLPMVTELAPLGQLERGNLTLAGLGITSLAGLESLTTFGRVIVGGCEEGEAMPALTSLAGIGAMAEISELWVVDAPALTDLSAQGPVTIEEVNLVDTPALDDAAIAAFMAEVEAKRQCAGDIVECSCIGLIPETVTTGCPQTWSGGSAVAGMSEGGPFNGTTAFFGWRGSNIGFTQLALVILDATSDIEAAKQDGIWENGVGGRPKAILYTDSYYNWIGESSSLAVLYDGGGGMSEGTVELAVNGRLGNWHMSDPADPPRLVGTIKTADPNAPVVLDGPFQAAFCEDFVEYLSD